jgi:plasmid stability protein
MRTTIDIPDETFRALEVKAAQEGQSVEQVIQRGILRELEVPEPPAIRKMEVPVIHSSRPGTLDLTNEQIDDILFLP